MATLLTILNLVACGLGAVLGTGTKGCSPFFKKVSAIWLTPQGFVYDGASTFDSTYINQLQAEGNLIILKGIRTFTDNTPDDTIDELEDGTKQVARLGLYEFSVQFINGMYFHAALHSLNSYGNYDVTFVDIDGNILGTRAANGSLKGFTAGMVQGGKFQWATDSTAQREGLMCQLLERSEFDNDYVFIDNSQLDFAPQRLDGINEVVLEFGTNPVSGTSETVKATLKQGGAALTGLTFSDFLRTVDGATSNPTADDSEATGAGIYVLTVGATSGGETVVYNIYDNSNNREVIDVAGDLFKSNTLSAVVV